MWPLLPSFVILTPASFSVGLKGPELRNGLYHILVLHLYQRAPWHHGN